MNLADLLKKNFVLVPVVASVLVGTFTGVRYIVNLTDTINQNELRLTNLERDVSVLEKNDNHNDKYLTTEAFIFFYASIGIFIT